MMNRTDVSRLSSAQLAQLLGVEPATAWPAGESAAILKHQLGAPLLPDLGTVPGAETARLEALVQDRIGAESFIRQMTSINPSLELLQAIKRFSRFANEAAGHPLRGDPAMVIYHGVIAAAIVRCKTLITQLPGESLREGFTWAAAQPGAEELRAIFEAAPQDPSVSSA